MEETLQKEEKIQIKEKERFLFIDILESIAIFFVVLYHSTTYVYGFLTNNIFVFYLRYYLRCILSVCVPIFFFCNGFLLFSKEFNLKKHLMKILKFFILILVWGTITLTILSFKDDVKFSFSEFLYNLIALKQGWTNHLWFLYALCLVYFIFPILKVTYDNNKKIFIYFIIFCLIVTIGNKFLNLIIFIFNFLCFNSISNINFNLFNIFNTFGIYGFSFAYFCLGGVAYYLLPKVREFNSKKLKIISIFVIFLSTIIWFLLSIFISKAQKKF